LRRFHRIVKGRAGVRVETLAPWDGVVIVGLGL
jgi:hypothetical protein